MTWNRIGRWTVTAMAVLGIVVVTGIGLRAHAQAPGVANHECTIHFTSGKTLKFRYSNSDVGAVDRFVQGLGSATVWVLELDRKTFVVPTHNVEYLEVDPAIRNFTGPILKGALAK